MRIGFIGLGTMGRPVAENLLSAGHDLIVHDVVSAAVDEMVELGASAAGSVQDLARNAGVVFLSLPGPAEIDAVIMGIDGVRQHAAEGTIIVDLSTSSVAAVRSVASTCDDAGLHYVDAPVSGGAVGARAGTLSILVGTDDDEVFATIEPLLQAFGRNIVRAGSVGGGTLLKLINNQVFLSATVLVQEAFVFGAKAGLSSDEIKAVLDHSTAGVITRNTGFVLNREFNAQVFKLSIATKDLALSLESAEALAVSMPMTEAAHSVFQQAVEAGYGDQAFYATVRRLEDLAGAKVAPLSPVSKEIE